MAAKHSDTAKHSDEEGADPRCDGARRAAGGAAGRGRRTGSSWSAGCSPPGCATSRSASFVSPKAVPAMAGGADVVAAVLPDVPDGVTAWALVPNVKGAELATAAGVDHLTITVSASPAYSDEERPHDHRRGPRPGRGDPRRRARRRARRGDLVRLRLAVRRRGHHARRRRRVRRPRPRRRRRSGHARRHHRRRHPAAGRRRARPRRHRRRAPPPRHPGHRAAQRVDGDRPRRDPLRHRARRARRLTVRPRRRRQPATEDLVTLLERRGPRHRRRPRRRARRPDIHPFCRLPEPGGMPYDRGSALSPSSRRASGRARTGAGGRGTR